MISRKKQLKVLVFLKGRNYKYFFLKVKRNLYRETVFSIPCTDTSKVPGA